MSQPTQQLPPWLQPSVVVVTDAAGAPVATNTEIVYVPPTYFGPSIPLGSLYIFGGSTEPATIVFTPTTTATPTATPTTTSPLTTSATPTTTVPTTSTAITSSPSLTTTSPSATPSTTATNSNSASSASASLSSVSAASSASSISSVLSSIASSASAATSINPGSASTTAPSTTPATTVSVTPPSTQTFTAPPTISPASPARFGGLTKGQLVGVIVASILGLIFLFVLALFLCLWCKGRRNRRHRFQSLSPGADNEDSYVFVPAGSRVPGEGSPRHSGEEADPFLQESSHQSNWVSELGAGGAVAAGTSTSRGSYRNSPLANVAAVADSPNGNNGNGHERNMTQLAGAGVTRTPVTRVPPPTMGSNSSGTASTVSHASGFGVLLERPSISGVGYMPITHEHDAEGGRPLSQADLDRIDNGQVLPSDDIDDPNYDGAYAYSRYSQVPTAPPRLVIPAAAPSPENLPFSISNPSSLQDLQEASVQTATRVKAQDLAPRSSPASPADVSDPSNRPRSGGFLGALGLGGIGALFHKSQESSARRAGVREQSSPLMEKDLEQGALMAPDARHADSLGLRPAGTGLTADGRRPVSNVSGRSAASGGTIFHDAQSSLPATPITPSLAPLPRAVTPAEPSPAMPINEHAWMASLQEGPARRAPTPSRRLSDDMADADILDMPAPSALHHFSSGSSLKHARGASTDSGIQVAPFPPPGLSTIRPVGWANAAPSSSAAPVPAETTGYPSPPVSLRGGSEFSTVRGLDLGRGMTMDLDMDMEDDLGLGHGISIDVLEEAPPGAEQGWRSISSAGTGLAYMDNARRGTFGTLVQAPMYASEQGSLHSMRSHVTPGSVRSSGSAPASRHDMSVSSSSSGRPSLSSNSATSHNLARTGSLTSDNQQRGRRSQPPGGLSTIVASPTKAYTPRTIASDTTAAASTVRPLRSLSPLGGPDFPLNAPWAAGLDNEWQASA